MQPISSAVLGAVLGAALGLACGVLYAFGGLIIDLFTTGLNRGTWLAFGALIGMPAIFSVAGLVGGFLLAVVVNGVRSTTGGSASG